MSKTYSIPQLAPIDEPPFNLLPLGTAEQLDRKAKDARAARIEAALHKLVNYNESDPDLLDGDDDGALRRIMADARAALADVTD